MSGIDRFNIADVAMIHGISGKERNGEFYATCPFCGNAKGKFSYIVSKKVDGRLKENLYKCWSCGAGGTAIDLHINLSGNSDYYGTEGYKKAVKDIFKAINGDISYETHHRETVKKTEKVVETADKASDGICSSVYYAMLKILTLEPQHKADLIRRGLTEDDIIRFRFRSVPEKPYDVCKQLVEKGYELKGVPGFYQDKKNRWTMKLPGSMKDGKWKIDSGYFCPVFDGERNLILGFQIRVDHPKNDTKYLWFSSSGKQSGVSSGAISTYLPGELDSLIILTEGILKALIIYCLLKGRVTVIGIPGVKSIKPVAGYLERYGSDAFVFEAYDMDKAMKPEDPSRYYNEEEIASIQKEGKEPVQKIRKKTDQLAEDTEKLHQMVAEYDIPMHPLRWDMDKNGFWKGEFKGLDDFLYSYEPKELFVSYLNKKASVERPEVLKQCS